MQIVDVPWIAQNKYIVVDLPDGQRAATQQPPEWIPTLDGLIAGDQLLFVQEESSVCLRVLLKIVGGVNLRPLTLHFYKNGREQFVTDKPCR